jgi:GxxExxY protein
LPDIDNEEEFVELLFKQEVYDIIGAAIEVHRTLGSGFLEAVYQEAMEIELASRQIPFRSQVQLPVYYKGTLLTKCYCADLLCFEAIVVEFKAVSRSSGYEKAQVLNYLKATGMRVGLLINFGDPGRLDWERFVLGICSSCPFVAGWRRLNKCRREFSHEGHEGTRRRN